MVEAQTGRQVPGLAGAAHGSKLTDGALDCNYCAAGLKPTYRCYFPLYDRTGTKRVVALNQDYDEAALLLALHQAVLVKKVAIWGSPLAVEEDMSREPWEPRNDVQLRPLFLHEWLLQVWHDAEISKWVATHPFAREQPQIAPRVVATKKAAQRLTEEIAKKVGAGEDMKETVNRVHDYMKKLFVIPEKEPGKNGKPHK